MTRSLEIVSDIRVKPKGRPRFHRGIAFTDSKTREFESTVRQLFKGLCKEPFEGPIEVSFVAYMARPKKTDFPYPPRGDVDNLFKSVADAANEILWEDDSQIVRMVSEKKWSDSDGFFIKIVEKEML